MNLLLTTFPGHLSRNVGDNLICSSAAAIITSVKPDFEAETLFRETPLDEYEAERGIRFNNIIAPGFSVSNGVYPALFRLYADLERLPAFFPFGCSFQHVVPARSSFMECVYDDVTLRFLRFVVERSGPLPCRDMVIAEMLNERFGIPAFYSGDLALFDGKMIGAEFTPPTEIRSLVFTIGHHERYSEQSLALLRLLAESFPDATRYAAFHSAPRPRSIVLAAKAAGMGYETLHMDGDVANLDKYDDIDLHVGYRLHGHIAFLRKRKPSILMVEDARAYGFSRTDGTAFGCIDAFGDNASEADPLAPARALELLRTELAGRFNSYREVFRFIDTVYNDVVLPYFIRMAVRL